MVGPNYKPKPPRIVRSTVKSGSTNKIAMHTEPEVIEQIAIDLKWWEANKPTVSAEDRDYLNSIVIGQAICPAMAFLRNEERARKLLGLEATA